MQRTKIYVFLVVAAAFLAVAAVRWSQPLVTPAEITAVAVLAVLAIMAETLTFVLPRSAQGSIAFIPYLAAVMIVPAWPTVAAAASVKFAAETFSGRAALKKWFNVAQHALALALAILTFRLLGGTGMLGSGDSLLATTMHSGLPALAAFVVTLGVNLLLVQTVIAISNGISIKQLIRENVAVGIGFDLLASPIVFLFAWIYAKHGPIAAFAMWAPMLGLRQLTRTTLELEQTNQELLELMVKSIEARDAYTSGHSRRVRDYAEIIGRAAGFSEREVASISKAALLHDVGKIHEKYAPILAKPDKLTPDEWQLMQQHPLDGAELVGTMTRLRELLPAIRHHHEQWDGMGYPDALAGENIPRGARIIAIADTIDAMSTARPYRSALDADDVRNELIRCRGRQFDPSLIDRILAPAVWQKIFAPARNYPSFGNLEIVRRASGTRSH